jgi:cyanate permease
LHRQQAGLLTTLPLAGYGYGLPLIVPLGDLLEDRRLILRMTTAGATSAGSPDRRNAG